ncbi:lantibiotic dehydratase [Nonomuraea sp. NPDC003560]|uniref:lantibiotic dehydratase n=1 Tax=Nonomuraea sp. NPDC003560 TaxID=3364341 RepID=UPI0036C00817
MDGVPSHAVKGTPFEAADQHAADLDPAICVNAIGTQHGRSWHLFPRFGMAHAVLPTVEPGAEPAQLSFHPCRVPADLLTRTPQVLPRLVSVGEFRPPGKGVLLLGEVAVDVRNGRLYLAEVGPEAVELSHLSRLVRRRWNASRMAHPNSRPMAPTSHRFLGWCTGAGPSWRTGRAASSPPLALLQDETLFGDLRPPARLHRTLRPGTRQPAQIRGPCHRRAAGSGQRAAGSGQRAAKL